MIAVIKSWPLLFTLALAASSMVALVMGGIPALVYAGMAPKIDAETLLIEGLVKRGGSVVLPFALAFAGALALNPNRRPLTGATLLIATIPMSVALMLWGLR